MIEVIKEYALVLLSGVASIGVVGTIINLVKVFSQKTLNKSFEIFRTNALSIRDNSESLSETVIDLTGQVKTLFSELQVAILEIEELKELIKILESDSILTEIRDGLLDMAIIKQSIDMKDALIETFGKEMTKIKNELEKINRKKE